MFAHHNGPIDHSIARSIVPSKLDIPIPILRSINRSTHPSLSLSLSEVKSIHLFIDLSTYLSTVLSIVLSCLYSSIQLNVDDMLLSIPISCYISLSHYQYQRIPIYLNVSRSIAEHLDLYIHPSVGDMT